MKVKAAVAWGPNEPLKIEEVVQIIERLKVRYKINFFLLPDHFLKQLNAEELAKNNCFHFFDSDP
ncbi:MAG: hypothetical protein CL677_08060, partial [Bdellovibrionaceae bacterium]|nr:hypothetical protein [Pseudobdellovibrionaceae bacterium]